AAIQIRPALNVRHHCAQVLHASSKQCAAEHEFGGREGHLATGGIATRVRSGFPGSTDIGQADCNSSAQQLLDLRVAEVEKSFLPASATAITTGTRCPEPEDGRTSKRGTVIPGSV